jgi:hypothetical protein
MLIVHKNTKKMKIGILGLISALMLLSACSSSSSTARSENKSAGFEQTAALIESGNYQFTVRSASPSGGRTFQITSIYVMKATDGTYEARLPYFGRAYSGAYGDGGSVVFEGEPENLQITRKDGKNTISVKFNIKSDMEQYYVKLQVSGSGYGNLVVSSQKRQTISYYGLASALED